jgi:RecB family exonuclease
MAAFVSASDATPAGDRAIVVPTRAAAAELRRTVDTRLLLERWRPTAGDCARLAVDCTAPSDAFAWPDVVTRDDLYGQLHARLDAAPRLLSPAEREVRLRLASDVALSEGATPPFTVRPGLLVEMLALYDALRRRQRSVDDLERVMGDRLAPSADTDRGARRLLEQTRYLVAVFREYEAGLTRDGLADEHRLRNSLAAVPLRRPYRHLVVTVGDEVSDAHGLWPADFDLMMRLEGLTRIDIVATEAQLSAGFRERLEQRLHGIAECRPRDLDDVPPLIMAPPGDAQRVFFLHRDRERELAEAVRRAKSRWSGPFDEVALVYQRPLPYLYLARQLLDSAGVPYDASDALPLAAEPFAAAFDLVLTCLLEQFSRASLVALLGSPQFGWGPSCQPIAFADLDAFDEALDTSGYTEGAGGLARQLDAIDRAAAAADRDPDTERLARVAAAAREALDELARFAGDAPATEHLSGLARFLRRHERTGEHGDRPSERLLRARAAVHGVLAQLLQAHREHGDRTGTFRDLAFAVRRWIEAHTFSPRSGQGGLRLLDATAARYGTFDAVHLLGLVEGEWPEPASRSVLYPSAVLADLGWPQQQGRIDAARASFVDLLSLARRAVSISAFTLEDEALVPLSILIEDVERAGLAVAREPGEAGPLVFASEAMLSRPTDPAAVSGETAEWLALRASRSDAALPEYHGYAGRYARGAHAVTAIELYLTCPFKYFASKVLRLGEDRRDEPLLSPLLRGRFVHEVFQTFFANWSAAGRTTVSADAVPEAREVFQRTVETLLPRLPPQDRAIERARLLGTAVSPGLGDRVLQLEAETETPVVERLLEYDLAGSYTMMGEQGPRDVTIRGIADRIDLVADGTLRLIDYKTGRAPDPGVAVQLPIYALCAERVLAGRHGREWRVGSAAYVAFGESKRWVPVIGDAGERDAELADAQRRFVDAVDAISRGAFPARPANLRLCRTCAFAAVCRKDVLDDD